MQRRVVAWFSSLQSMIKVAPLPGQRDASEYAPSYLNSALITVLKQAKLQVVGRTDPPVNQWITYFWDNRAALAAAINILKEAISKPVFWLLGSYEGGYQLTSSSISRPPTELEILARRRLLAWDVVQKLKDYPYGHVPVIVRVTEVSEIIWPSTQGFGHFDGVRLAVFSKDEEPYEVYSEWLRYVRQSDAYSPFDLIVSDFQAPLGCRAWLCPYGCEDRDHATIALTDRSSNQIAEDFAQRLDLPLISAQCTQEEWQEWEFNGKLFQGLTEGIEQVCR
jgi:hypothetical protein